MLKFKNGEDFYNRIYLIFNALIATSLLPFSLVFLDIHKNGIAGSILNEMITYFLTFISIVLISYFTYKSFRKIKHFRENIDTSKKFREKLEQYYKVFLKHYVTLNLFAGIITVIFYLTRTNLLIICYVILLVLLSLNRPTLKSIISELKLSKEEEKILYEKQNINP